MAEQRELQVEQVPLRSKVWLSGADAGIAILQTVIVSALTSYYMSVRGLDPVYNFIAWILFMVWNSVNDPLFGYISDRTKSKLGRRKPYIRFGAPFIALFYILAWVAWPGNEQWMLATQLFLFLFLYDTLYTAVATSLYVMPYEMAVSNKARTGIFIWKTVFSTITIIFPLAVLPLVQPESGGDVGTYQIFHVVLGVVVGAVVFASTYFYDEKHYRAEEKQLPFFQALKESFKNRSFLVFEVASFTVIYCSTGLMMGLFYYMRDMGIDVTAQLVALVIGILAGIVFFVEKNGPWGVKKCMLLWAAVFSASCAVMLFFGQVIGLAAVGFGGIGIGFAGGYILIPLINGEVIDKDEDVTGLRREGMYAGINSFITKPAISIAQGVFPLIIAAFGYNFAIGATQSELAKSGILIGWMLIPAVLLLLSLVVLRWYPLDGPGWLATKERLAKTHAQKEKEYLEKIGIKYVE